MRTVLPLSTALASFTPANLDEVEAAYFLHDLAQRAETNLTQLLINCGQLKCLRHLGVSYVGAAAAVSPQRRPRVSLQRGPAAATVLAAAAAGYLIPAA